MPEGGRGFGSEHAQSRLRTLARPAPPQPLAHRAASPRHGSRVRQESDSSQTCLRVVEGSALRAHPEQAQSRLTHEPSRKRHAKWKGLLARGDGQDAAATTSSATSVGVVPTLMPTASSASFFACAVPLEPLMIAPAWPIVLPGGAEKPAM